MYKLVSMDMDGTLLNENHVLSKRTVETVKRVQALGVRVTLVSGREFNGLKNFYEELELEDFMICLNGANLYRKNKLVLGEAIENTVCSEIIHMSEKNDIYCILFDQEKVYVEEITDYMNLEDYIAHWEAVGRLSVFFHNQPMYKMVLAGDRKKLLKIKEKILTGFGNKVNANFSLPNYLEIFSKKVDKGRMVKRVAEYYGIEQKDILSIGDWDNDISMIEYAGLGVAMGNGSEGLKSAADYITKSNREDGAACALEKFILNKV